MRPLPRVLIVDDDHLTRTAHVAMLGGLRLDGEAVFDETDSPEKALEMVQAAVDHRCPYAAVMVDQALVGGMDGTELCGRIAAASPGTLRVMVTGDAEANVDSRVGGHVQLFFRKPVDVASLQIALTVAIAQRK